MATPKLEIVSSSGVCPNCKSSRFKRKDKFTFHCDDCGLDFPILMP